MQVTLNNTTTKIVILGTGGTIAGTASNLTDNVNYAVAQVGVADLINQIAGSLQKLGNQTILSEQVAQVDSKDMSFSVWQQLALRVNHYLEQDSVNGVIITHGTDTLEETAYFLHAVLPSELLLRKPVVLTCAMRPSSSASPDGPQNLMDAIACVNNPEACGVVVVCAGTVHGAVEVRKIHPYRLNAFSSGDSGPVGYVEEGHVRVVGKWPNSLENRQPNVFEKIANVKHWPRVEIVMNYVGASGAIIDALLLSNQSNIESPVQGLVVAATGNGTVHHELETALRKAVLAGVKVVLSTRCAEGRIVPRAAQSFLDFHGLSPVKARVALMLALL
jgi:L-asparaginase